MLQLGTEPKRLFLENEVIKITLAGLCYKQHMVAAQCPATTKTTFSTYPLPLFISETWSDVFVPKYCQENPSVKCLITGMTPSFSEARRGAMVKGETRIIRVLEVGSCLSSSETLRHLPWYVQIKIRTSLLSSV